ncbi:hypothetical protein [Kitasatospora mediocidica]|uniref:hypothetical protein n=1 Tax=Kitasatospora mediocidica TaxID=58352 RepID=UPI00055F30F7|nr:hypothetical protein [Kitasatospora mediocidica]
MRPLIGVQHHLLVRCIFQTAAPADTGPVAELHHQVAIPLGSERRARCTYGTSKTYGPPLVSGSRITVSSATRVSRTAPERFSATGPGSSRYPGALAILLARGFGHSIICSGTSSLALIGEIPADDLTADALWGFEVGTLRLTAASTASSFRPAMGFGVVDPTTGIAEPIAVPISRSGAFTFDEVTYAA